jgi:hypothetical protein
MIKINKFLFIDIFNKNYHLYVEFINSIKKEYSNCINCITPFNISNADFVNIIIFTK